MKPLRDLSPYFRIVVKDENIRLLAFLRKTLPSFPSVKAVKKVIEQKGCEVNGKVETFSTHPLRRGDEVLFDRAQLTQEAIRKEISILYEDEYFLFCNKPVGMICDEVQAKKYLPAEHSRCLLVHRLDKETSGVLLFAKNQLVKEKMVEMFKEQMIRKEYEAIVDGKVRLASGVIQSYLCKKQVPSERAHMFSQKKGHGQFAITHWTKVKVGKESTHLLCYPKTGRTHQIRVHLSEMNHPIVGDQQYGKNPTCKERFSRHLLHAKSLEFLHPFTHKNLRIEAPLPADFLQAKQILGLQ